MKQSIKSLLLTAALGLWASAATAHHIAGSVLCTDTTPATPLGTVEIKIGGTLNDYYGYIQADGTFYVNVGSVSDTYTVTIVTPAGLTLTTPPRERPGPHGFPTAQDPALQLLRV